VACIDDLHDRSFCADLIINHALGVTSVDYVGKPWTSYLLGFDYALLRKPYLEEFPSNPNKKFGCMILIGGSDPQGITLCLLDLLEELHFNQPIAVVVGDGFNDTNRLQGKNHVSLFKSISGLEVLELMKSSAFGIFPASTTSIEACAARLPFICGYYVKNQLNLYNGLKQNGLAKCIGSFEELSREKLGIAIQEMNQPETLEIFRTRQATLLDKGSRIRFINAFKHV
jgi:spore coat polysaccharide biosynthesis predicted glycosyltransferase SpsG